MKHMPTIAALALMVPVAGAEEADDPWARVPALPTACYTSQDTFNDDSYAAIAALEADKARQVETNDAISQQLHQLDMMEQQQRMVAYLTEHPEEAERYMQSLTQAGQLAAELTPAMNDRLMQLETRRRELEAQYQAALQESQGPLEEKRSKLEQEVGGPDCTQAAMDGVAAVNRQLNAAYAQVCADWWESGPFHEWFAEFRQTQTEWAAQQDEQGSATKLNFEVMGIASDGYRPTSQIDASIAFLRQANGLFAKRRGAPYGEKAGSCGSHG